MKTDSMNQQQKREKAAELLGWRREKSPFSRDCTTIHNGICGEVWWHPDIAGCSLMTPLYDEDLNVMHEAEKVLETTDRKSHYLDHLYAIVCIQSKERWEREWFSVVATAAQRLDAWLEVMMEGGGS